MKAKSFSLVRPLETPWTAAYQAPPSMGFSRQGYWSEVPLGHLKKLVSDGLKEGSAHGTEKAMAPHSSTLAWKIPWTEEPGRLRPWGREKSDTTE